MKKWLLACLIVLICSMSYAESIVQDNFNSYSNGPIVGQGGWESYVGNGFVVQDATVFEGAKALYNHSPGDSVIGKKGNLLTEGRQSLCVKTENRNGWDDYTENVSVRMTKGLWAPGYQSFTAVAFKKDGRVAYLDPNLSLYHYFDTYEDNVWTLLETEWRSDAMARYRVNNGTWTDWALVAYSSAFVGFDYVGFDFSYAGSGGVYFDTLGTNPVPEPSTWILLITALITGTFLLRRKR